MLNIVTRLILEDKGMQELSSREDLIFTTSLSFSLWFIQSLHSSRADPTIQHLLLTSIDIKLQHQSLMLSFMSISSILKKLKTKITSDEPKWWSIENICLRLRNLVIIPNDKKKKLEDYAYRESAGARRDEILRQARSVDMMNCRLLYNLRNEHEDYVRDLTYMRWWC